jgi:hypothetical protein
MVKAKTAAVLSMVGALSLASYGSANAAPLTPLSAAAKPTAQETGAVQVRWGGWGWGVGAGVLAGALIGAATAAITRTMATATVIPLTPTVTAGTTRDMVTQGTTRDTPTVGTTRDIRITDRITDPMRMAPTTDPMRITDLFMDTGLTPGTAPISDIITRTVAIDTRPRWNAFQAASERDRESQAGGQKRRRLERMSDTTSVIRAQRHARSSNCVRRMMEAPASAHKALRSRPTPGWPARAMATATPTIPATA